MGNFLKKLPVFAVLLLLGLVFQNWFRFESLSSGDWLHMYPSIMNHFSAYPYVWNIHFVGGYGNSIPFILGLETLFQASSHLLNRLNLGWIIIERVLWFWPYLIVSFASSYFLFKSFFKNGYLPIISSLIYVTNTYALMLVGGGQMGVAMAYAVTPLALGVFVRFCSDNKYEIKKVNFLKSIILGVLIGLIAALDLRIIYIAICSIVLYAVIIRPFNRKTFLPFLFFVLLIPSILAFLMNAFWAFPFLALRSSALEVVSKNNYLSIQAVRFFSFAKFENAISLLQPNWPDNIFGKVSFLRAEFLIIPLIAFLSFLFAIKEKKDSKKIAFLGILALIGIFLAKGTNEPFGYVYELLFERFPGFFMFRDSTKWYLLIVLSYCVLIPYSIGNIGALIERRWKPSMITVSLLFIAVWSVLIKEATTSHIFGTFTSNTVPVEYLNFERFVAQDNRFFRTLWIPTTQRYGYSSELHPALSGENIFKTANLDEILKALRKKENQDLMVLSGVRYVVVPTDPQKELFLTDRKYDPQIRNKAIDEVETTLNVKKIDNLGKLSVFERQEYKDHIFLLGEGSVSYERVSPVEYKVSFKGVKTGDRLVLSDSYSNGWKLIDQNTSKDSEKYILFNSWVASREGDYVVRVYYDPQKWVNYGFIVSLITGVAVVFTIAYLNRKKE